MHFNEPQYLITKYNTMYKNQTIWPYHNENTQICNISVHVRSSYFPMTISQKTYNTSNKMKCPKCERINPPSHWQNMKVIGI